MTEKELRRLSRLELLELLLEQIKEKEALSQELEELKNQRSGQGSPGEAERLAEKMSSALEYAYSLTERLERAQDGNQVSVPRVVPTQTYTTVPLENALLEQEKRRVIASDRELYWRMMYFYRANPQYLNTLPEDIRHSIISRLRGISNG